jgi:pimeloyl-ACP methyl ester carboxylesterase
VGGSDRLYCPQEEPGTWRLPYPVLDIDACIQFIKDTWGDTLNGFTTTAAARDVGELIKLTRQSGQRVFVWGGSYGSYLAHRYLQLFPDQPDGVIMAGISPPHRLLTEYDYYFNLNVAKLFDLCARDLLCSS